MKKILFVKAMLYFIIGIVILSLNKYLTNYLSYVVGPFMIVTGLEEFIYHLVIKDFKYKKHSLYTPVVIIILAVIILIQKNDMLEMICIIWGIIVIIRDVKMLNECVYYCINKDHFILEAVMSIISLCLAIMLIMDPAHHARMHLCILGIEMIFEALKMLVKIKYYKKNNIIVKEEIEKRKIIEYIKETDQKLYESIKDKLE